MDSLIGDSKTPLLNLIVGELAERYTKQDQPNKDIALAQHSADFRDTVRRMLKYFRAKKRNTPECSIQGLETDLHLYFDEATRQASLSAYKAGFETALSLKNELTKL